MAKAPADIRSLARAQTELAVRTLTGVCGSKAAPSGGPCVGGQRTARPGLGQGHSRTAMCKARSGSSSAKCLDDDED